MIPSSPKMVYFIGIVQPFISPDEDGCQVHLTRSPTLTDHLITNDLKLKCRNRINKSIKKHPGALRKLTVRTNDHTHRWVTWTNINQITCFHLRSLLVSHIVKS